MKKDDLQMRMTLLENKYDQILDGQRKIIEMLEAMQSRESERRKSAVRDRSTYKLESKDADPLLKQAGYLLIDRSSAGASPIVRELGVGLLRAAKIYAQLEYLGLIVTDSESGERKLNMTKEQFQARLRDFFNITVV